MSAHNASIRHRVTPLKEFLTHITRIVAKNTYISSRVGGRDNLLCQTCNYLTVGRLTTFFHSVAYEIPVPRLPSSFLARCGQKTEARRERWAKCGRFSPFTSSALKSVAQLVYFRRVLEDWLRSETGIPSRDMDAELLAKFGRGLWLSRTSLGISKCCSLAPTRHKLLMCSKSHERTVAQDCGILRMEGVFCAVANGVCMTLAKL